MKRIAHSKTTLLFLALFLAGNLHLFAQEDAKIDLTVNLRYFMYNNKVPFVSVQSKTKVKKKFQPVPGVEMSLYLDSIAADHLIAKVKTNEEGDAGAPIPPALKALWDSSAKHKFMVEAAAGKNYDEASNDIDVSKARILIDTTTDGDAKSVKITLQELKDKDWSPVKGVDLKVGIQRLGGFLTVSKEESYTTDSLGQVVAEFKRDSMPGDAAGTLTLVAKVEDNEQYGNLVVEKSAPWGVAVKAGNDFNKRTLFATRNKAPLWLLFMAYAISLSVWAVLIYLIGQVIKINKIGKATTSISD
jgi:hypothetical protein